MYAIHNPKINAFAQRNADNFADTALMVVLSIQQNWYFVGDQLDDVRENKLDSRFLWGNKRKTYLCLQTHKHFLYSQFMAVVNSNKSDREKAISMMQVFLRIDGLGLPKAGFLCQLCAGLVGCIDIHNIRMYNIDPKTLTLSKTVKSHAIRRKRIENYVDLCHDIGTETLWNTWCDFLSTKSKRWIDGNHVSEVHYTFLL